MSRLDASSVSAVVGVNLRVHDALGLNDLCRGGGKAAVKFVYARTLGGLGGVFCDFGNHEFVPKSPVVSANEEVSARDKHLTLLPAIMQIKYCLLYFRSLSTLL